MVWQHLTLRAQDDIKQHITGMVNDCYHNVMPLSLSRNPGADIVCHNRCSTSAASFASRVKSNQCSRKITITCLQWALQSTPSVCLSLGPRFKWGQTCHVGKNHLLTGKKWNGRKLRKSPRDRHAAEQNNKSQFTHFIDRMSVQVNNMKYGECVTWKRTRPQEIISKKKTKQKKQTYLNFTEVHIWGESKTEESSDPREPRVWWSRSVDMWDDAGRLSKIP